MNKNAEGIANIHNNIRNILKGRKRGLQAWQVVERYRVRYGKRYSESGITARLRECRDVSCNLSDYTYSIQG